MPIVCTNQSHCLEIGHLDLSNRAQGSQRPAMTEAYRFRPFCQPTRMIPLSARPASDGGGELVPPRRDRTGPLWGLAEPATAAGVGEQAARALPTCDDNRCRAGDERSWCVRAEQPQILGNREPRRR